MLITAGIFLFGFMAVYSLFLIGVEARREAESITRTALAADAMLEDWRLRFSQSDYRSSAPGRFVGNAQPLDIDGDTGAEVTQGASTDEVYFYRNSQYPGVLFL